MAVWDDLLGNLEPCWEFSVQLPPKQPHCLFGHASGRSMAADETKNAENRNYDEKKVMGKAKMKTAMKIEDEIREKGDKGEDYRADENPRWDQMRQANT